MWLSFGLLGAAIVAVWLPDIPMGAVRRLPPWQALFVAAVIAGLVDGPLTWPAPLALGAIWLAAWASTQSARPRERGAWTVLAAVLALAFAASLLPGFTSPVVAANIKLSAASMPMTMSASFDKPAAGLILLVYLCSRVRKNSEWTGVVAEGIGVGAITAIVVIALVASTGVIRLDPKLPSIAPAWLVMNLMQTSLLEEAFFRGIVQERLARALAHRPQWRYLPIAVASALFGLAHSGGGLLLVLVASLAGIGYGIAYARTGRIEAAVLAHVTLNTIHFLGFTYPYAVR